MRIANIIIFHDAPGAVERLIGAMQHPQFDFYLHLDKKVRIEPFRRLQQLPNTFFIKKRKAVQWAGFSQLEAILNSIEEILDSGRQYEFINLLSGQDYPIKSPSHIYEFLKTQQGKSFMIGETPPSAWWNHAYSRFTRYHFIDYRFKGKFRIGKIVSKFLPPRKFPLAIPLFGGPDGAYWILSIEAARYVYLKLHKEDKNKKFFKHTWGSDEFLLHTILMDSPFRELIVNENYHLIDRSHGGTRPRTLTTSDLPMLKASHKFFARKFDAKLDAHILDLIDEQLLGKKPPLVL